MPIPTQKPGEPHDKYRSRLIDFFMKEGKPQKQAIAISYSVSNKKKKSKK
jgi:hypothetical protein